MTLIKQEDFIQSIADALQYISYYHPLDFIQALNAAYETEQSRVGYASRTFLYPRTFLFGLAWFVI
jgi:tartrate dehydratase alpha subunit/fumarate hydratase class I-like protein